MVNLVDEALRGPLFERPAGFAAADVIVADPAVGTGTFLLGVLRRIAATVADGSGCGRGARRDRGRREAPDRFRNPVRPVRRRAASADRRDAGADEYAQPLARASPVHHRHARQSVHRGGDGCRRSTSRSRSHGATRTRSRASSRSPSSSAIRPTRKRRKGAAAGSRRAQAESSSRRSIAGGRRPNGASARTRST